MNGYKLSTFILLFLFAGSVGVIIINSDFDNNKILNPERQTYVIPEWVKNNAYWWSQNHISDKEYSYAMEYMIDEGIISVKKCIGTCLDQKNDYNE